MILAVRGAECEVTPSWCGGGGCQGLVRSKNNFIQSTSFWTISSWLNAHVHLRTFLKGLRGHMPEVGRKAGPASRITFRMWPGWGHMGGYTQFPILSPRLRARLWDSSFWAWWPSKWSSPHSHREFKCSPCSTQEYQAICNLSSALSHQFQIHVVMEHTGMSGHAAAFLSAHFRQQSS